MSDLISRQAAIDIIEDFPHGDVWNVESMEEMVDRIKQLPPIQPKRGKWNRLGMDALNCNRCGATFVLNQGSEKMHFCPNCGADMRGEQDE